MNAPHASTAASPAVVSDAPQSPAAGRLAPLLCGLLLGSASQLGQAHLWSATAYAALAVAALAMAWVWRSLAARAAVAAFARGRVGALLRLCLLLAAAWLGSFAVTGLRATAFAAHALSPVLEGADLLVTGRLVAMPQLSAQGTRFRFAPERAEQDGVGVAVPPLIELGWWSAEAGAGDIADAPDLRPGQRWQLTVRLKAPHGSRNPHGFDYELRAWQQGVQALGSVRMDRASGTPRLLGDAAWRHPVERLRQSVRDAVLARLAGARADDAETAAARRRAAGVVAALVTGDQQAITQGDWDVFRATGVAHLMSISGLHVTMFAWLAALAVGWLWRRSSRLCLRWPAQHAALVGGVALAAVYALFSGGGLPSQRTVFMLAIFAGLRLSGRRWPWPQAWLAACAGAVALDPWALQQAGFWLSFVAVGVLFASGPPAPVPAAAPNGWRHRLAPLRRLLREQMVVTFALAPLSLLLFGQVSLVGLPANLLAIPWTTLVVTPLALLGVLVPPLWDAAAGAVRCMEMPLQWMAALPFASLSRPAAPNWVACGAVAGGALVCLPLPWRWRLLGVAPVLPCLLWSVPPPAPGSFELLALDVGQGSAVLVRTAGHALLYDTGPRYGADSDAGQRLVVPLLQALGQRLDTVVLSHRDSDHVGGALAVLRQQPSAALLASIEPEHPLQRIRPARRCEAGQHWRWDGVDFRVLWPPAGDYRPGTASNALSCVLRIEAGGRSALLTGDIAEAEENRLLASGVPLSADWLLVPHHGSRGSSGSRFLAAVAPPTALAQAGYRNRFGHPAADAQARYRQQGIRWFDTIHCGAATWRSQAPATNVCEREREPHYWQHNVP
ncbi:DNA internalization-related competence protein ComEC/Rec2 [Xylophilus sp. Kf1]|nr:DNA internalization-related competence protein ComEC/Rec2 [Xylophilus sp. Kf1]